VDLEQFREYCLSKLAAIESTPFGEDVLVFKVAGKIFALAPLDEVPATANLKCDPDLALELRDRYEQVRPRLSHEQKTLEHSGARQWNSQRGAARDDRSFLHASRAEFAESETREAPQPSAKQPSRRVRLRVTALRRFPTAGHRARHAKNYRARP
jgi:YjbR